ncbi:hypothetical protein [Saccharopolyspora mangrovi]|uniref:Uncharacterized protein n=1 Tax=Saccharopolyspora mangrovi TaxID=3082379 RepID=A0ABU6AIR0_9PSEU|nr:hypothetical protein [Saccharopolyspora sp. S2-29]MEB3371357.1 hypothetical protein [Saccharopolyspora sp. S2-29]
MNSNALASQHSRTDVVPPGRHAQPSSVLRALQVLTVLALIPVLTFYLCPRIFNLVAIPYRLDQAVVHANRYNLALHRIVAEEKVTLAAFAALDRMDVSVSDVRSTDARVAAELRMLIGQIRGDLQATLDDTDASVQALNSSLDELEREVRGLHEPVGGAEAALAGDRARLAAILNDVRSTAADVHKARQDADQAADNVSGD